MNEYIKEICKIGQANKCCRYLMMGSDGFECAKLNQSLKAILDKRVESNTILAQGNNCEGKENLWREL